MMQIASGVMRSATNYSRFSSVHDAQWNSRQPAFRLSHDGVQPGENFPLGVRKKKERKNTGKKPMIY